MANNSFMLKGCTITLIVAIFALADKEINQAYFLFTYIPAIVFWFLNSYYLQLERKYKVLYNQCTKKRNVDFDLEIQDITYGKTKKEQLKYRKCIILIRSCNLKTYYNYKNFLAFNFL